MFSITRFLIPRMERLITRFTRDGDRAYFDTAAFPWVPKVEGEWPAIRAELDTLLLEREKIPSLQYISEEQKKVTGGDDWKTFFFYAFGHEIGPNCARCPATVRALRLIPGLKTAMFSILVPGKHIPAHRGLYKGVLRYHLGLLIPRQNTLARLRVRDEIRSWEEGKSLIFDDSYQHEVWNDSDAVRAILLLDFVRPLPFPLSWLNRFTVWLFSRTAFVNKIVNRTRHPDLLEMDEAIRAAKQPAT